MPERACKAGALYGIHGTVGIVQRPEYGESTCLVSRGPLLPLDIRVQMLEPPTTLISQSIASSELQTQLERNHAGCAIAAQAHAEQTGRWRGRVGNRSKSSLGRGLPRNAGQHHARKCEIRMIE